MPMMRKKFIRYWNYAGKHWMNFYNDQKKGMIVFKQIGLNQCIDK
jgi:hypothetical protein